MKLIFIHLISFFPLLLFGQNVPNYSINKYALDSIVNTIMKEENIPGISIGIILNDSLTHFSSYGNADKKSKTQINKYTGFQIASLTKPIIASLAMKMYALGVIDIHKPINEYIPEVTLPNSSIPITLAHLLSHSSGLPQEPINRIDIPNTPTVPKAYSKVELYDGLKNTDLLFTPGTSFQYSNLGFKLAGHILEKIGKKDLEELLKEEILDPLNMKLTYAQHKPESLKEASYYWRSDNAAKEQERWIIGDIWGSGGLTSTMSDMARFTSLQFKRSNAVSSIIPAEYIVLAQAPRLATYRSFTSFMGLGWNVRKRDKSGIEIYHSGGADGHSSYISCLPEDGIGLIVLANIGGVADEIGETIEELVYEQISDIKKPMGDALYKSNWDLLSSITQTLIAINPSNSRAHYFLGKALYKKGLYSEAEEHLEIAIEDGVYADYAYFYLASCAVNKNDNSLVLEYLTKSVNLGYVGGDELLSDDRLKFLSNEPIYKKLARWGHGH